MRWKTVPETVRRVRGLWRPWMDVLLWVSVLGFAGYRLWPQAAAVLGLGAPGEKVPALTLVTLDGDTVHLADLRGRVVLVNYWATWCLPCRVEMPGFEKVYRSERGRGFTVLGIATDRTGSEPVAAYLRKHGITYPIAMETPAAGRAFGAIEAIPTSILIDARGRIRHRVKGIFAGPALHKAVDRLLEEASRENAAGAPAR